MEHQAPRPLRIRFRIEVALAAIAAVLTVVTAVVPDWIERLTGESPDAGSGEAEWMIAVIFAVAAVGFGLMARREWRRARLAT
jgi:hypothetical protein